jgi:prepilin-type N-terminal cleavage/methylation domain-containing protein
MKKSMFDKKQKGFTLLELLVVITLLAVLSVGALVAYEGIGDTAQATAASNNTAGADQAIRNYKAITQNYPDQWDNLVEASGTDSNGAVTAANPGTVPAFIKATEMGFLDTATLGTGATTDAVVAALNSVGINAIQTRVVDATTTGIEPNLQHNEGAAGGDVAELIVDNTLTNLAVLPAFNSAGACTIGAGVTVSGTKFDGVAASTADASYINKVNDSLENDECHLVVALGFGHDAAHSTNNSSVAISTAPTFVSKDINPSTDYARYIALFHVASADETTPNAINTADIFEKARLIAVVDTEGHVIDENIADANVK